MPKTRVTEDEYRTPDDNINKRFSFVLQRSDTSFRAADVFQKTTALTELALSTVIFVE
jgi:hypothetical protein